jgi:hypothetical protein
MTIRKKYINIDYVKLNCALNGENRIFYFGKSIEYHLIKARIV